jgi:hypothetical protein
MTPVLPLGLREIVIENLAIGGRHLGLRVLRNGAGTRLQVMDNPDKLDITVHPIPTEKDSPDPMRTGGLLEVGLLAV